MASGKDANGCIYIQTLCFALPRRLADVCALARVVSTLVESGNDPRSLFGRASFGKTAHTFPGSTLVTASGRMGQAPNSKGYRGCIPHLAEPRPTYAVSFCRETQQIVAHAFQVDLSDLRHPTRRRANIALARQAAMYLANVAGGVSFSDVARGFGRDRSTVAHACSRIEDLRDDPRFDRSLALLEGALRRTFRLPDLHGSPDVHCSPSRTVSSNRIVPMPLQKEVTMTREPAPDVATRRLLKCLSARGVWLEQGDPGDAADGRYRLCSKTGQAVKANVQISPVVVSQAAQNGWLQLGEGRVTLTAAGARSLRHALSSGLAATDHRDGGALRIKRSARKSSSGPAKVGAALAGHQCPTRQMGRHEPVGQTAGFNEAESPLGWLRKRKDKDGQPLMSDAQFAAGERLRADVFFAGLSPRTTGSWSATAGTSSGGRSAPGGSAQMLDTMVAARQRVSQAMRAVGPELSGILLDVCGFLKGLEGIEAARGWPSRSGKVVLILALSRLAVHYGMSKPGTERVGQPEVAVSSRIRHWGARDYRPDQGVPDLDDAGSEAPRHATSDRKLH